MALLSTNFASRERLSAFGGRSSCGHDRRLRSLQVRAVVEAPSKKDLRQPRTENVGLDKHGAFYVDHTCIGTICAREIANS